MFLIYSLSRVGLSVAEVKLLHDQGCPDLQRAAMKTDSLFTISK